MRLAFLYPGQGSQQPGMGSDLLEDAELSALGDACADAAGVDLRRLLTQADDEELRATENAQPALCFTSIALTTLLRRRGIEPAAAAGHSVGEYAALWSAGCITATDAVRAVAERGRAMASAMPAGTSSMAAVLGLPAGRVEAELEGVGDVWPANYNTATQLVIGGRTDALAKASEKLKAAGAKRVLPLNVSAAFHTPLMRPAAAELRRTLDRMEWREPAFPVPANVNSEPRTGATEIPDLLERQLYSPVRWADCVNRLIQLGIDTFIEVGPKRALTGMLRELAPGATALSVSNATSVLEVDLAAASA